MGSFKISIFKNKSDLPIAFNRFKLIALIGLVILAKTIICKIGITDIHFEPSNNNINGSDKIDKIVKAGKVKKAQV